MFLQTSKFHVEVRHSWSRWLATLQLGGGGGGQRGSFCSARGFDDETKITRIRILFFK